MFPGRWARSVACFLGALIFSVFAASSTSAHAVLVESRPALQSIVTGPDVTLKLRFNVRIDVVRSRLTLILPDGSMQMLEIDKETAPDTISSQAKGLQPGTYRLRWQVLASDGHITRGEIPFTVTKS